MSNLSNVWRRITDLQVATGRGSVVTSVDGDDYLDFTAGIATTSTGHCHPAVVEAISTQAARFIHAQTNVYTHDLLEPLAAKLTQVTPGSIDTFLFTNSGVEAIEAAVKLARRATGRPNLITFEGGFHGRTHMAMAMSTANATYRQGYGPLPSGVFVSPYPDPHASDQASTIRSALNAFDRLIETQTLPSETAAIVMEPVLGDGGYVPAPKAFVEGIAERCAAHNMLFIADEIQTGCGRTGNWFACDYHEIEPDIICIGKGIASGFPFAALGTRRELDDRWGVGGHSSTYAGNPIGCAAALATLEILSAPGFMDNVVARGRQLKDGLSALKEHHSDLRQVRGPGLMIGTSFATPDRVGRVREHCLEHGQLILVGAGRKQDTIRWMPSLIVTAQEIDHAVATFAAALHATR